MIIGSIISRIDELLMLPTIKFTSTSSSRSVMDSHYPCPFTCLCSSARSHSALPLDKKEFEYSESRSSPTKSANGCLQISSTNKAGWRNCSRIKYSGASRIIYLFKASCSCHQHWKLELGEKIGDWEILRRHGRSGASFKLHWLLTPKKKACLYKSVGVLPVVGTLNRMGCSVKRVYSKELCSERKTEGDQQCVAEWGREEDHLWQEAVVDAFPADAVGSTRDHLHREQCCNTFGLLSARHST